MAIPGMTGGETKPLVKFNARVGKWYIDNTVTDKLSMLVDFDHGESGWARFAEGTAPSFVMVSMASLVAGGQYPPMPPDVDSKGQPVFRRAFRLAVKISDQVAKGRPTIGEFSSGSLATVRAIDKLHTAWLAGRQDGKVPVVLADGTIDAPGQWGANHEPILRIVKWIDRPSDFKPDALKSQNPPGTPQAVVSQVAAPIGEPESFDAEESADEF
jgi:hypothetical protein